MNQQTLDRLRTELPAIARFLKLPKKQQQQFEALLAKRIQTLIRVWGASSDGATYEDIAVGCDISLNTAKQIAALLLDSGFEKYFEPNNKATGRPKAVMEKNRK